MSAFTFSRSLLCLSKAASPLLTTPCLKRHFQTTRPLFVVKPFLLADIGEGIRECEIIQWFVEPGARVEQFDNICEVQSDKASVEISSRYDGVIKKLYYEAGDMAIVGKPLVDIDVAAEVAENAPELGDTPAEASSEQSKELSSPDSSSSRESTAQSTEPKASNEHRPQKSAGKHASLATPAVRRVVREHGLEIEDIRGTGKDGRVLKEDVTQHIESAKDETKAPIKISEPNSAEEETAALTPVQNQMFKIMTKSLSIPHFLYADEVILDPLVRMRSTINASLVSDATSPVKKISFMPFFIKAVSLALNDFPLINSRVDLSDESKPKLVNRPQHNIGVAMDTPNGLLVPNIKSVNSLSLMEIASELARLQSAGAAGKLAAADLKGGTITLSNIGNVGGTYVAPVIVTSEVAIMGIGRSKVIPAFDSNGAIVPKTVINFSWSADHRVVDGSTMARMADLVKTFCENPEFMMSRLR